MKILKAIVTVLYFGLVGYIVFFTAQRQVFKFTDARSLLNVVPIINKISEFQKLKSADHKEMMNYAFNLFGNIVLFIPYSLIMVFVFNIKKESIVILTALLLSVLIETLQFILELGVADIDDVLLNISGAFIGWAIAKQIIRKEKGKVSVLNFL